MIHHTLKAEVIREMITSECVCGVVWFGMCVGSVLGGGGREGMLVKVFFSPHCGKQNTYIRFF